MSALRRRSNALSVLAQMASFGPAGEAAFDELQLGLRDLVPFDVVTFAACDDKGEVCDFRASRSVPQKTAGDYLRHWYNRLENDCYAEPMRHVMSRKLYDCVRMSDAIPRLHHSAYFSELLRPVGLEHGARLVLRDGRRLLGTLSVGRAGGDFSARDVAQLRQALPHLSHALARRDLGGAVAAGPSYRGDGALLLVDREGRIRSGSAQAWTLLHRAAGRAQVLGTLDDPALEWAQPWLAALVRRVASQRAGEPGAPPLRVERNRYGTFHLRGYALESTGVGEAAYGIQIERRLTLEQRLFASERFRRLTAREREVSLHLARGATPAEIAQALGVRTSTAIFHVRNVYERLDINQRAQLVPALLG